MSEKYAITISLNVLNHLGLNLYSNTPAVLAEAIANAWDADATEVSVNFDIEQKTITITDNGHGMDLQDINNKYLYVGYGKRDQARETAKGRKPMGRKGIGKLSLFSIANKISVFSQKQSCPPEAFLMDANELKRAIQKEDPTQKEDPSSPGVYNPQPIPFEEGAIPNQGTSIRIQDLKKVRLTQGSIAALRKRIARRFGVLGGDHDFRVSVNGSEVTFEDRDYFHKARFIFEYGNENYARHCTKLDTDSDTGNPLAFPREYRFNANGDAGSDGQYEVRGWIAIAHRSNDLDDSGQDDNLNKITIAVRGKVALEDILQEYRLGGMITKFIYGEINADFLDDDDLDDIATSSRQSIAVDDPRFIALRRFVEKELRHIWIETNRLKEKKGLDQALSSNPHIKRWYEELRPKTLQESARKIFGAIDRANVDEAHKQDFYADGILAFETLKMNHALAQLDKVDESNLELFIEYLGDLDSIEAARYSEIVRERLAVIDKLQAHVAEDLRERIIQEYVFDHLWLFDPSWERATGQAKMEERLQAVIDGVQSDSTVRLDVRYRKISGAHVIIELKRASRSLPKTEIESQLKKYIDALRLKLAETPDESRYPIEAVCLVGKLPRGWKDPETRKMDETSLKPYGIRVMSYSELIDSAHASYAEFLKASNSMSELRQLIERIRAHKPS